LEITSVEFNIKTKMILATTLDNQIILISPRYEVKKIQLTPLITPKATQVSEEAPSISESLIFESQKVIYICLGFSNGQFLVENFLQMAKSGKINNDQIVTSKYL